MNGTVKLMIGIAVKSVLCALLYVFAVILGGGIASAMGFTFPNLHRDMNLLMRMLFISGLLLSVCTGFVLIKLDLAFYKRFLIVFSLLFINTITQLIEGIFFSDGFIQLKHIPALLFQQFTAYIVFTIVCTALFKSNANPFTGNTVIRSKLQWFLRFCISSGSYVLFYYIFGRISYSLFTNDYYARNINGLSVPDGLTIFILEIIRSILLTLSVLPAILRLRMSKNGTVIIMGMLLSVIGGINPMLQEVGFMPPRFLISSGIEMTLQFFATAIVAVYLLYPDKAVVK